MRLRSRITQRPDPLGHRSRHQTETPGGDLGSRYRGPVCRDRDLTPRILGWYPQDVSGTVPWDTPWRVGTVLQVCPIRLQSGSVPTYAHSRRTGPVLTRPDPPSRGGTRDHDVTIMVEGGYPPGLVDTEIGISLSSIPISASSLVSTLLLVVETRQQCTTSYTADETTLPTWYHVDEMSLS